jgi:hypothetical protein
VASGVIYGDIELYLIQWFRTQIAARGEAYCQGVVVDRIEPPEGEILPKRLLVVRFDGKTRTSFASAEAAVGLSVLAGTKLAPKDALDLANMVLALSERLPSADPLNPVAAVLGTTGPVQIADDLDRARVYSTLDLAIAGQPF